MKTDEDRYVEQQMTWFDWVCYWSWTAPIVMIFALVGNGILDLVDYRGLLIGFVCSFAVFLILRVGILHWRVNRLRDEYYVKKNLHD